LRAGLPEEGYMLARKLAFAVPVALLLAAAACNVKNVEVHGSYRDAAIRDTTHPVVAEMFNLAFKAVKLPAGSISAGDYVAVYRLSSGKAESAWWGYFAEDWIVDKVRAAGATPVERNGAAVRLLEAEGAYLRPPGAPPSLAGAASPSLAKRGEANAALTPYRATRALAYRVVAAELWFDRFSSHGRNGDPTVRANAKVTVNLRTLDVQTGEVLWSGVAAGTARKTVEVGRLLGWFGIDDWEDWDDGPFWWHRDWDWDGGSPSEAEPADDVPADQTGDEDDAAEEPAQPDDSYFTSP
jgi:hypothetical protein